MKAKSLLLIAAGLGVDGMVVHSRARRPLPALVPKPETSSAVKPAKMPRLPAPRMPATAEPAELAGAELRLGGQPGSLGSNAGRSIGRADQGRDWGVQQRVRKPLGWYPSHSAAPGAAGPGHRRHLGCAVGSDLHPRARRVASGWGFPLTIGLVLAVCRSEAHFL